MIHELQLRLLPWQAANMSVLKEIITQEKGLSSDEITHMRIIRRSIDARKRTVFVNLSVRIYVGEEPEATLFEPVIYKKASNAKQVVVVGAGPAGLFAALRLLELGIRPIVVERGKDVHQRKKDLALISRDQQINSESNYCFGEGGAGAYSDGKLFTRSKKRGPIEKILRVFCQHGASTDILIDAHPHIGTDRLPRVIENIRNTIVSCGGEMHFSTRMTNLLRSEAGRVVGIEAICGNEQLVFHGPVILATGHSARDVYEYLAKEHVDIEAKGIAVGVRLEHPSKLIDQIQYHTKEGRGDYLPAAEYAFVTQVDGRGVYSFCMCPGGFVIPAATANDEIVVNGMSPSNRAGAWSNSGMVVELRAEDVAGNDPLRVMRFQEELEHTCWLQGNRKQTAPAQRMADFVAGRLSYDLPPSSYSPGLISSPIHFWLPPFVSHRLQAGFRRFGQMSHGFLTNEAQLIGVETRTSSPVRIVRHRELLHHVSLEGLYPCGEGAGYAGGIVSAAIDGERCALAAAGIATAI